MKKNSIKLDMDINNLSFFQGSAKQISTANDIDYVSRLDMILPREYLQIPTGLFKVEYKNYTVDIKISLINNVEEDFIFNNAKNLNIGASGSGLDFLPFEAFTDNRGEYPAVAATLVFPKRIASWIDDTHPTGMKMDYDYEAIQVTGAPNNEEKTQAIIVLNKLIKSFSIKDIHGITYDDVTVFLETYFRKSSKKPLLLKVNALTSKDAYKQSVYDYMLPNLETSEIRNSFIKFKNTHSKQEINNEKDLKLVVEEIIESVLKYHIEIRRWIEPFWDGKRKMIHNGEEITIPSTPKSETKIQPTLHVIMDMALSPLGIQVIRESDEGAGLLDYRFLFTTKNSIPLSIGVEFKVAHRKKIKHGIARQLPTYLKAIKSKSGIFVIMWFKDTTLFKEPKKYEKDGMNSWLSEQAKEVSIENGMEISTAVLDASIRPSASNL